MGHSIGTFQDLEKVKKVQGGDSVFTKIVEFLSDAASSLFPSVQETEAPTSPTTDNVITTEPIKEKKSQVKIDNAANALAIQKNGQVSATKEQELKVELSESQNKLLAAKELTQQNKRLARQKSTSTKGLTDLNRIAREQRQTQTKAIEQAKEAGISKTLSPTEIQDVKKLDTRRAKSKGSSKFKKKRSGLDTVILKKLEEKRATKVFDSESVQNPNFDLGLPSDATQQDRQRVIQRQQERTQRLKNAEAFRELRDNAREAVKGRTLRPEAEARLNIHGDLSEASIVSLLKAGTISPEDLV